MDGTGGWMRSHGRRVSEKSPDLTLLFILLQVFSFVFGKEKPNFPLQKESWKLFCVGTVLKIMRIAKKTKRKEYYRLVIHIYLRRS